MRRLAETPESWRVIGLSLVSFVLACLLLWGMIEFDRRLTWLDGGLMLNQAEYLDSEGAEPPPEDSRWSYTLVPDEWNLASHQGNNVWYRFYLNVASPPRRLWGIYLPVVWQNASVWLNGELLGDGGSFDRPLAHNANRPLYFSIPRGLIEAGENRLLVRVKSNTTSDGLIAPVFLAPADFLYAGYRMKFFYRYTLLQFIILTLAFSALLLFALSWLRPKDRLYAWYALPLSAFAIYSLKFVVIEPPVPEVLWERITTAALLWFPVLAAGFIQRFIGTVHHRIERLSLVGAGLLTAGILLVPGSWLPILHAPWINTIALLYGLYPIYLLLRYLIEQPRRDTFLLTTSGFLMIVFGFHDWLVANGLISRLSGFFLAYSTPPGLLLFAYILMRRFVQAMNESEHLNRNLQQEVARKHQELEQSFEQMKQLERQHAISEERARLMRDMHDGMGGHLIALLARIEDRDSSPQDIARDLQTALDDLRLMIDSMEDVEGDLLALMAMLRYRLEPRLNAAGIRLKWQARDLPPMNELSPEKALHILRIFQEAITNILKHAHCREVILRLQPEDSSDGSPGVLIECIDDGDGFKSNEDHPGRGLKNIQRRAHFLAGRCGLESEPGQGTRLWLWLPIQA